MLQLQPSTQPLPPYSLGSNSRRRERVPPSPSPSSPCSLPSTCYLDEAVFHATNSKNPKDRTTMQHSSKRKPRHSSTCISSFSFLLVLLATSTSSSSATSPFRIIIDVGSTGSRLHIFEMVATTTSSQTTSNSISGNNSKDNSSYNYDEDKNYPRYECQRRGSSKAWTPLSAFASNDDNTSKEIPQAKLNATHVAHHMLPLFDYASHIVPPEHHSSTPVRIAATAGMRLLPEETQSRIYDALFEGLLEQVPYGLFSFTNLRRKDVMTLDGEREGFYGAVAANYLRGVVDAELKVIVPPESTASDDSDAGNKSMSSKSKKHTLKGEEENNDNDQGICTNKFGMCEPDAENVVFGPSHHYVPGNMHDVKRHGPLGALDMGGSSTQIVYRHMPSATATTARGERSGDRGFNKSMGSEHDGSVNHDDGHDNVPSHLHDEEFFSTSYLSYGADQFRERLWDLWVSEAQKKSTSPIRENDEHQPVIFNPCSFGGYQMSYKGYTLVGTGNAVMCTKQINRLIPHHDNVIDLEELYDDNLERSRLNEDKRHHHHPEEMPLKTKKMMVGGVEHPPIRGKFYGMSLYFFTLDCLRELSDPDHPIRGSWPTPSIEELTHALDGFCARNWAGDLEDLQHEAHEHTRAEVLPHRCIEAVYMVTLLRDGFGFHPSSRDITFTQWVSGNEVEWSLGMVLSEFAAEKGMEKERAEYRDDDNI
mmetsp:Transcript_38387/g.65580  ORF Transcript_38387/g.65580 Transcript_38387/m.65580 type:complete len:706 (-) Transcript_38387:62-2179(-)